MEQVQKSTITIILLQSFLFFGLLSVYFGKDNIWDIRNYHYYNAHAFLHNRLGYDYLPAGLQTFLNPLPDLPYYYLIEFTPPVVAGFIMGGIHGLNFWLIFLLALWFCDSTFTQIGAGKKLIFALFSAGVGVYGGGFLPVLGTATNDNLVSIFVLSSLLLIIKAGRESAATPAHRKICYVLLSGLVMGMGIGFKLTVLTFGLGFLIALPFQATSWRERLVVGGSWGLGMVSGVLLSAGAWMFKMWNLFGNPLFPFYNRIFQSPYISATNYTMNKYFPDDWVQGLFYPFYFAITDTNALEIPFRDARWAVIYILLLGTALLKIYRKRSGSGSVRQVQPNTEHDTGFARLSVFLIIFFISSYLIWQLRFSLYRFLIPLELLAPVIIAILITRLIRSHKLQIMLLALVFTGIIASVEYSHWERLSWKSRFFEIDLPEIEYPENTIVLITQKKAWSYLIPFFPPALRFVRVNTYFTEPGDDNKFQAEMSALLKQHKGPIYLLSNMIYEFDDQEIISRYGLRMSAAPAAPIKSRHEMLPGLMLWKLERIMEVSDSSLNEREK